MSKNFTLNYLINSYNSGKAELKRLGSLSVNGCEDSILKRNESEFEPSQRSIDAIMSFASQYEVMHSSITGGVELNLN